MHCHLLPGVDDGAATEEIALEMARHLSAAGFRGIAASPHMGAGPGGDVTSARSSAARVDLAKALAREGTALDLFPNGEHHVTIELFERLGTSEVIPIGGESHWLLIEMPWGGLADPEEILFRLQTKGYRLLLAHPERNDFLSLDVLERLVDRGVRLQLELGSFIGRYSGAAQQRAEALVERGVAHVLASDLHYPENADRWLPAALQLITSRYGRAAVDRGGRENPRHILADAVPSDVLPMESIR